MWCFHHDNVPDHRVLFIQEVLAKHFLFLAPRIKMTPKGKFQMSKDFITNMKNEVRVIKKHPLIECSESEKYNLSGAFPLSK
jgi:hypothetical protein